MEKAFRKLLVNKLAPVCSVCGKRYFVFCNYSKKLKKLRAVGEYKYYYDSVNKMCRRCWTRVCTMPCDLCGNDFDVLNDRREDLLNNLRRHNAVLFTRFNNARHICPACYDYHYHVFCSRCSQPMELRDNWLDDYNSYDGVESWLRPFSPFYSTTWNYLCKNCFNLCIIECRNVKRRLNTWAGSVKGDYIDGFRTVKTLARVSYNEKSCVEPGQVENYLKLYTAQLGGNGFVKYYWEKQEKRHAQRVLAGYSKNDNPYYRTEYSIERWFTGYATAVIAEPVQVRRTTTTHHTGYSTFKPQDIRLAVLDGMNICCWSSFEEQLPDLAILLTLCIALAEEGLPFFCFFDANTRHVLHAKVDAEAEKIYTDMFYGELSSQFVEVPGKTRADEFVLQKANSDDGHVISNDQFREYKNQYPWLNNGDRLIKGTVADGNVMIPDIQLNQRIRKDLSYAMIDLRKTLKAA